MNYLRKNALGLAIGFVMGIAAFFVINPVVVPYVDSQITYYQEAGE